MFVFASLTANSAQEIFTEEDEETQDIQKEELQDLPETKNIPEEKVEPTEPKGLLDIIFGSTNEQQAATKADEYIRKESVIEENYSDGDFLNTAVLKVIDRTIGKLYKINLAIGSSKQIGNITIKAISCWNPAEKTIISQSRALLDINEATANFVNSPPHKAQVFNGWIVASHPAASFIKHPIYDISLSECIDTHKTAAKKEVKAETSATSANKQEN